MTTETSKLLLEGIERLKQKRLIESQKVVQIKPINVPVAA